jgi:hypothetical protein
LTFEICKECDRIIFDLTGATVVPSSMTYFIEYIHRLTKSFDCKLIIRFRPLDSVKEVTKLILEEYYPALLERISVE